MKAPLTLISHMKTTTAVCFATLLIRCVGHAQGTLDQQYLPSSGNGLIVQRVSTVAQTFEVGLTGILDRVEVQLARNAVVPSEGMTLEIRSTLLDGSPAANVLASAPISAADLSTSFQFMSIDFLSFALEVNGGDMLALVLRSDAVAGGGGIDPFAWGGDGPGGYNRGSVYLDYGTGFGPTAWDIGFKSYVDTTPVPEPSSLALLLAGVGLLLCIRTRNSNCNE
jgi:hypothetical protein